MKNLNGVIVLCSGGLDSAVLASYIKAVNENCIIMNIKYGQKAQEIEDFTTTNLAKYLDVPKISIDINVLCKEMGYTSALFGTEKRLKDAKAEAESTFAYVPFRNSLFSILALQQAEKIGAKGIILGINADENIYPDNGLEFLIDIGRIARSGANIGGRLVVDAPFVNLTKKEIIEIGIALKAPFELSSSCYFPTIQDGKVINCGDCGSDYLRIYAFKAAGYKDPAIYEKEINWGMNKDIEAEISYSLALPHEEKIRYANE